MKTISIRELHMHTGKWVREAATTGPPLIVSDRGCPAARLLPLEDTLTRRFADRTEVEGFAELRPIKADSAQFLEEDRR